jgi:hypothetical protein
MYEEVLMLSVRKGFLGWLWIVGCAATLVSARAADGQSPQWNIIKPSTTGVPGEEIRVMTFDPQGNLWIVGRWTFWGEVGLATLPASELPYTPLSGGGFDTGAWQVWSNVHHPIPSPFVHDIDFAADGKLNYLPTFRRRRRPT